MVRDLKNKSVSHYFTESPPVEKKWGELMKYNIFIMKIIEFVSMVFARVGS